MDQLIKDISAHLAKQRKQSRYHTMCAYRGANDTMCAVGFLLPDELYEPNIEGCGVRTLLGGIPKFQEHLTNLYGDNLQQIEQVLVVAQRFHDTSLYTTLLKEDPELSDEELATAIEHGIRKYAALI